jgi:DNA (cytosine-5)-methyltransferase 1
MLTSVELFAGAGGLGMGLTLAGFRHLAVIERDQWACDTIRRNQARGHDVVAHWPLHQRDVRDFDFAALVDRVDVVAGGPPCQPFSLGGRHRGNRDGRDMFPVMADAICLLRPRAFIVENVKGLTRASFADYFDYIVARLTCPDLTRGRDEVWPEHYGRLLRHRRGNGGGLRYDVSFRVLNAADYGVPQKRERVFIVGFRRDPAADPLPWSFPPPTHSRGALLADQAAGGEYWDRHGIAPCEAVARRSCSMRSSSIPAGNDGHTQRPWRTTRDALADLPDPEIAPEAARHIPDHRFQPGARFYPGHTGSPLDWPAKTLKAGDHGVPGGENALLRPDGTGRYFTVREAARLQTFPDRYVFGGSWSEVMRQLGNAVPLRLAHAVAANLAAALNRHDSVMSGGRDCAVA